METNVTKKMVRCSNPASIQVSRLLTNSNRFKLLSELIAFSVPPFAVRTDREHHSNSGILRDKPVSGPDKAGAGLFG